VWLSAVTNEFDLCCVPHPLHLPPGGEPRPAVHPPPVVAPPRREACVAGKLIADYRLDLGEREDKALYLGGLRCEVRGKADVLERPALAPVLIHRFSVEMRTPAATGGSSLFMDTLRYRGKREGLHGGSAGGRA
jgi:hypothetical protein